MSSDGSSSANEPWKLSVEAKIPPDFLKETASLSKGRRGRARQDAAGVAMAFQIGGYSGFNAALKLSLSLALRYMMVHGLGVSK